MKIIVLIACLITLSSFSQTYQSVYSYTKSGDFFEPKDSADIPLLDTENRNNKTKIVLSGKLNTISDNRFTYVQFLIEKTNASPLFKRSDTMIVLIDTEEKIIYDLSNGVYRKYVFPLEKELFKDGVLQSVYSNDSIVQMTYMHNHQMVSYEENKNIPKNVRGLLLTSNHKWGVSDYHSSYEKMSLISYKKLSEFSFEEIIRKAKESCKTQLHYKELMFL
ncbi:MAG: hypothetical protein P8N52_01080 [Crocinitomicaceae bacterium]|nr:hypothetical protein [Crocinitomicaceae bacterium]MDG1776171.1 hypothetical protein [Crocinitomicaceae bacterium]